jgi:hypothetical protein
MTTPTYGPVDPLASTIRYASLDEVKRRLGIPATDTSRDAALTQTIIAGEVAMDQWFHRSLPDTGDNPAIPGVPEPVKQAAENIAVAFWKQTESPFGVAGSDEWIGELSVTEMVRREMLRSPLMVGYRVGFGIA